MVAERCSIAAGQEGVKNFLLNNMEKISTLRSAKDFDKAFKEGRSLASHAMVLYYVPTEQEGSRVAFCVGKRLGNAVWRNRVRRRLREAFRQIEKEIPMGYHLIWVSRKAAESAPFDDLYLTMKRLLVKAAVLKND